MSEWISVDERFPEHGANVRTRGRDGREFDCQFTRQGPEFPPRFKLIGMVWDHAPVTHWMPLTQEQQP